MEVTEMAETKYKMSQERYDEIARELEYLQTVREREVADQIREARSYGDLSENSEYDEAKTEQGKLYARIAEYKNLLDNAEIVESTAGGDVIEIGSRVRILDETYGEEEQYQIVGSQEANPASGRISDESPIGRAIVGHKVGETVTVDAPGGEFKITILDVSY